MGFVSNSSSGSFIMHWRVRTFGKNVTMNQAMSKVFEVWLKEGTDEFDWENTWNKEVNPKVEEAIKATVQNADGSFTTAFWTGMVNSAEDFGETAKSMVMGIIANQDDILEMIDAKIEMDY